MSTPRRLPPPTDRWSVFFPRTVQLLGAAGGIHEIVVTKTERPFTLIFLGVLILGMEGLRVALQALARRLGGTNEP